MLTQRRAERIGSSHKRVIATGSLCTYIFKTGNRGQISVINATPLHAPTNLTIFIRSEHTSTRLYFTNMRQVTAWERLKDVSPVQEGSMPFSLLYLSRRSVYSSGRSVFLTATEPSSLLWGNCQLWIKPQMKRVDGRASQDNATCRSTHSDYNWVIHTVAE